MTVYVALFLVTLAPAVILGIRRGGDSAIVAAVLLASFLGAHASWGSPDPILGNAMADLLCAALIIAMCRERWAHGIALLFLAAVFTSVIAEYRGIVAYAHILSIVGHAQNIGTIMGGRHAGKRYRHHLGTALAARH